MYTNKSLFCAPGVSFFKHILSKRLLYSNKVCVTDILILVSGLILYVNISLEINML